MRRWQKQTATAQRGISIARGAQIPKPSGRATTPLLAEQARDFLAALEAAHRNISAWLPTLADANASPADRTRASLAIMIEANSLTDDIRDLALATRADTQAAGSGQRAQVLGNIRQRFSRGG